MFTYFRQRRERKAKAADLYAKAVAQARLPVFYEDYHVPDSVDGRFEMISLHCYLLMRVLQAAGDKKISQALFDVFFVTMDRSLREMGVGDLGVPKHMKRMMQGFNGRANHYEAALRAGDIDDLKAAVTCNIFGTVENPDENDVNALAGYIMECAKKTTAQGDFAPIEKQEKKIA
ncbi:MAG TPA: ubiquinol-cytochrome C chaperone family protein [Alphaproteobacteria bacterium]|nr:ubiquinol-cytochrome C chaperone family protein [Alphaproteobacteria bacterium]